MVTRNISNTTIHTHSTMTKAKRNVKKRTIDTILGEGQRRVLDREAQRDRGEEETTAVQVEASTISIEHLTSRPFIDDAQVGQFKWVQ